MSRALFLSGPHKAHVGAFNLREGEEGETLIDVAAVGLCGSDLHYYKDGGIGSAMIAEPFVPGHEFAGTLAEDIEELGLAKGALVAVDPNRACGHCEFCERGHANLCPNVKFIGAPPFDGAMTQRIWVPKSQLVALPADFTPLDGVMLEPLGVAIHAVDLAKPRLLERVTLLGCGPIGLLILQVLKAAGAGDIVAVDPQEHRRAMASTLGAVEVFGSVEELRAARGNEGAPLVVEATNAPEGLRDAVVATKIGGRTVIVGIPDGDNYTLPAAETRRRGLKIKFARRMGEVYPRAIALVAAGRVDVTSMVTHQVGLEEGPDAFRKHAENVPGVIKSLIYPNA
ncbi:MAG: alcohol dehydrogenase catalytic domain-containing protein [Rhizobiaceae bacterium]|nr:alcohol dehydrogenase catalytic domain-containing protein [Rhizobiaceae bacterium]